MMFGLSILLVLGGLAAIWVSSRNSSQQLRQIGIGLIIAGMVIFALNRFDIPLLPS